MDDKQKIAGQAYGKGFYLLAGRLRRSYMPFGLKMQMKKGYESMWVNIKNDIIEKYDKT